MRIQTIPPGQAKLSFGDEKTKENPFRDMSPVEIGREILEKAQHAYAITSIPIIDGKKRNDKQQTNFDKGKFLQDCLYKKEYKPTVDKLYTGIGDNILALA